MKNLLKSSKLLWQADWMANHYFASAVEVVFTLCVSNLAILIGVFVSQLTSEQTQSTWVVFSSIIAKNIKATEILVFILGFIAPAIWIMVSHFRSWKHAKLWFLFFAIQIGVVGSTGIIFALSLIGALKNQALAESWANLCLALALIVWYVTLVYQKKILDGLSDRIGQPKPGNESGSAVLATLEGKS